jgi:predicted acylesterase/phospholipase RssA
MMKYSKQLTLKEYYDLIGVEFTCTSVDLHDKIERFFNHKTTPDLPICRAVQMTGSFPVAFLSLKWEKDWGKYYIHYDTTRRELDLEGHHFSDGGMLANFPL